MLTAADKNQIVESVRSVEAKTSGEVVVYVIPTSGPYPVARWRAGVFFFFAIFSIILISRELTGDWAAHWLGQDLSALGISIVAAAVLAIIVERVPFLERMFVTANELRFQVERNASQYFISEEIFNTADRTGILIFVSEFERGFDVVADVGITRLVADNTWVDVVDAMADACRASDLKTAIIVGVERCGEILSDKLPSTDDPNELDDRVRTAEAPND